MNITVNGKEYQLKGGATISDLLNAQGITGKRIALEVNQEILPRSEYSQYHLRDGDRVEIIRAIGGG